MKIKTYYESVVPFLCFSIPIELNRVLIYSVRYKFDEQMNCILLLWGMAATCMIALQFLYLISDLVRVDAFRFVSFSFLHNGFPICFVVMTSFYIAKQQIPIDFRQIKMYCIRKKGILSHFQSEFEIEW